MKLEPRFKFARAVAAAAAVDGVAVAAAVAIVAVVLSVTVAGCATTSAHRLKPDAQLVVDAAVPDARIYVDDVFAGRAAELRRRAILVRSGTRRVEIRADGYFTAYRDVTVTAGARAAVSVALRAAPPNEPAE